SRPAGAAGGGDGVRAHRGERAPRPGEPRAPADGRALHRPAIPANGRGDFGSSTTSDRGGVMIPRIDTDYLLEILIRLLGTPSPTGYTDQIVHLVGEELSRLGI